MVREVLCLGDCGSLACSSGVGPKKYRRAVSMAAVVVAAVVVVVVVVREVYV